MANTRATQKRVRKERSEPEIQWPAYPRIPEGEYLAYCKWAKRYRDPGFKRWTCLLLFQVMSAHQEVIATVPWWLNLGRGEKPKAGRRSRYFAEWIRVNGKGPLRGDRLSPSIFVRRMARVVIADTAGAAPYSVIRKLVCWETGSS